MGYKEKLQVVLDVDGNGAASGLRGFIGNFRSAVGQAEGMAGKFKAGVGAMGQSLTAFATSGAGMVAIGGAIGTALGKAVGAAQDLALQVGRLSDQTGLSNEQASRWIEITGDMGISSETLAGLLGKLTQNLGKSPEQFKALGVEIKQTADGAVDMNATLLNAIQVIDSMQDPTKRAELAAKLFGKGWKEASELIGMGADKVKAKLDAVGDAKVMSDKNVKDAREFRDTMEDLKDVTGDMATAIGKDLLPALTAVAKVLKTTTEVGDKSVGGFTANRVAIDALTLGLYEFVLAAQEHKTASGNMLQSNIDLTEVEKDYLDGLSSLSDAVVAYVAATRPATSATGDMTAATEDARAAMFGASDAANAMAKKEADAAYEAAQMRDRVSEATQKIQDLHDAIAGDKSLQDLKLHLRDNASRLNDLAAAYEKSNKTADDSARYMEEVASVSDDSKLAVMDYAAELGNIPPAALTDIITNMDPNNVQATIDKIQEIADRANLHLTIAVSGAMDAPLRNLLEGRGTGTPTGLPGTPSAPGNGGGASGGGNNGGARLNSVDGPQRGGDVYLQLDRQTLVVFKNALDDLSRGTR